MRTKTQWLELIRSTTVGLTDAQAAEAASIAFDTEVQGKGVGAWHAAAMATGNVHRCPCAVCRPDIKRYA